MSNVIGTLVCSSFPLTIFGLTRRRPREPTVICHARRPSTILGVTALVFAFLAIVMLFVWAYSTVCFLSTDLATCHLTQTVWTPLTWSITCGLIAAFGMAAGVISGLILCVRPALLMTSSSALFIQHWPRPAGLALLWAGLVITISSALLAFHQSELAALLQLGSGWGIPAVFVVLGGPMFGLMVLEFLVRRLRHRAR